MANNESNKERLARIEQKLDDFISEHKQTHKDLNDKLTPLVNMKNKVEQPFKWVGGIVTVASIGMFTVVGERVARWLLHFRP